MTSVPPPPIAPAEGRLGVLTVGLGAVASTLIAGVELTKRGLLVGADRRWLLLDDVPDSAVAPTTASR